jgi:hypothetical protein
LCLVTARGCSILGQLENGRYFPPGHIVNTPCLST